MACVGFDCGGRFSVVARVHSRGLTTALNEASKRKSGSLVSIKGNQRFIGAGAEPVARSNYKNTVWYVTRLIGRKFSDPSVQEEIRLMPYADIFSEAEDGGIAVTLSYDGQKTKFTATQCYAMLLGELKRVAINDAPQGVQNCDVVVTVPSWYDNQQRLEVERACSIAQVGNLGLINDATACGLIWGIWKNKKNEFDDATGAGGKSGDEAAAQKSQIGPCNVMFIDLGDSQMSCTIASYKKNQMQILTTANDKMLGGRLIDMEIAKFAAEEAKGLKKEEVFANPKALIKLLTASEKAKKTLSGGVTMTKVYSECLMNDKDLNVTLTKEKLEEILAPLIERFAVPIKRALSDTGLSGKDFHAVEIIGGSMRIPAFKIAAAKAVGVFKDDASSNYGLDNTLDMEEAASHGAAMKCALLSPKFRIQTTFNIIDAQKYPVKVSWDGAAPLLGDAPPLPPADSDGVDSTEQKSDAKEVPTLSGGQSAVMFDVNAKCGSGRVGERRLHFQRNGVSDHSDAITVIYTNIPSAPRPLLPLPAASMLIKAPSVCKIRPRLNGVLF